MTTGTDGAMATGTARVRSEYRRYLAAVAVSWVLFVAGSLWVSVWTGDADPVAVAAGLVAISGLYAMAWAAVLRSYRTALLAARLQERSRRQHNRT